MWCVVMVTIIILLSHLHILTTHWYHLNMLPQVFTKFLTNIILDMDDCLMNIWINIQFFRENLQILPAILSSKYLNYTDRGTELHVRQHYGDCSIVALYHCQYGNISIDQCLVTGCWWQWDNCMTTWSVHDTLRHWNIVILSTCIFSIV